ncbi:MAG TPA: DUF5916 domain-containing protein [Candidatus Eisenbacteria bacterium]|nr:DUF5916 domain-containing protein [Candidatus Eisenbacteria bacterium]
MRTIALALLMLPVAASLADADSLSVAPATPTQQSVPPVIAVRLAERVDVDGVLSEAVWQNGNAITDFKQRDPNEGTAPSQKTEVRVAYDDDAIYLGARCYDAHPESLMVRLSRRDVSVPSDRFSFYLDPYRDKRTGYYFLVNSAGTLFDGTLSNDGSEDNSWDGVWEAKARVDNQGYTVEMRIPFSQLRFNRAAQHVWGVNFRRVVQRNSEEIFYVYQPKKESGFVSRWPELRGIENINPPRSIELRPYVTSKGEFLQHAPLDPFNDGSRFDARGGADLRMGVGTKMTLNATVNPDFGQVEVDPAVVNLSDVESFFQEKRPFFVEGSSIFGFGNQGSNSYWGFNWPEPTFFYSRRIGRGPQGFDSAENSADYEDRPIGTSILGAAKLTGKLWPTVSFGTLHALANREVATLETGGLRSRVGIEPLTYYGVARGLKEFKDRRQGFGLMTTVAARSFENADAGLKNQLNNRSIMTGLDGWTFLDSNKVWVISGWSALSHVTGTEQRITSLQTSSRHYFQRPDADHIEVDPNATALTGFGSRYWLNKQKGNVIMNSALGFMSPSFDVADVGFHTRSDVINGHLGGGYKWTETTKHRKYQEVLVSLFGSWDFQGNDTWNGLWLSGFTEFSNNYSFNYSTAYNPQTVNTRATRGGPVMYNKPGYELYLYIDTDGKAKRFYYLEFYGYNVPEGKSYNWSLNPGFEWKPVSNVVLNLGPGYSRNVDFTQFVGAAPDPTATETYGQRYVFGQLDQTTVSANIRLNWAFTPTMSLQTYIQPLISAGEYAGYHALRRPRSYEFDPVDIAALGIDPQDFNFKSLRGNAVFRWEYMPGSTLFLVWTQERVDFDPNGNFDFSPNFRDLVNANQNNIFLAKLTYYFSL